MTVPLNAVSPSDIYKRRTNKVNYKNFLVEEIQSDYQCEYKEKRDCFSEAFNYLVSDKPQSKICVLYGLRRTGKTVLMKQCAENLSEQEKKKALFITCTEQSNMYDLLNFLDEKMENGYRYFFIDEITYAENFQQIGEALANCYVALKNGRIMVSGTDSLGLSLPTTNLQYCRSIMIHTTCIPFAEYSRLVGCNSIDEYIQKGSILEPDEFSDYYSVHKYIDTAISDNLINSLEKSEGINRYPAALTEIYEKEELKNAVERIINKYSQDLSAKAIRKEFKSGIVTTAIGNIIKSKTDPDNLTLVLNEDQLNNNIANALGIISNEKLSISITENHKRAIYDFLMDMDVFVSIPVLDIYDGKVEENRRLEMVSHPGLFHANVEHTMRELNNDSNWLLNATREQRARLVSSAYNVAFGNIMENFIISDMYRMLCQGRKTSIDNLFETDETKWYVSKLNYKNHEADMIIIDKSAKEVYLFEIKHSKENVPEQSRHLEDQEFLDYIESNYGTIVTKAVLYNGETDLSNSIPRISAQDFLISTYNDVREVGDSEKYSLKDTMDVLLDNGMENNKDLD